MWLQFSYSLGPTKSLALLEIQVPMLTTGATQLLVQAFSPEITALQSFSRCLNGWKPLTETQFIARKHLEFTELSSFFNFNVNNTKKVSLAPEWAN